MVHNIGKILNYGFKYAFTQKGTKGEIGLSNTGFGQKLQSRSAELKLILPDKAD